MPRTTHPAAGTGLAARSPTGISAGDHAPPRVHRAVVDHGLAPDAPPPQHHGSR
ncbi:hypothetical protein KIH74_32360 [Kineosporia sp. J2-2]|uniref:Uncharacterized protein n=1 Tax=Kineosporia corallincola TaxID=2835133 RepID=A0ABS5TSC6_9ACTN|nr:hypothetical protein [Kineosporia corallincola]MBT0773683.1 hypothetical protein [Kineosporia corallincola]